MSWDLEPLHSTLHVSPAATVYEARLPFATATALHAHAGVTAYVVVTAPACPVRTETVEWEEGEGGAGGGGPSPARLVPGLLTLAPGAVFAFVVADPGRPLVHRLITPDGPAGELAARIVGVEVRRRRGGSGSGDSGDGSGDSGRPPPPPPPPFTLAAAGPGFRVLRLLVEAGRPPASVPALGRPAVVVTVRGGEGLADGGGDGGGGAAQPPSPFVAAVGAPSGVLYLDEGQGGAGAAAASSLANAGPGTYEAAVVELY